MHLDLFSAPQPARGHLAGAGMLCTHRGSSRALCGSVITPPARMASPFAPPLRASKSPQPARHTVQQAGKWAKSWQPGHTDSGPELHRAAQPKAAPLPVADSWGGSKGQQ